MTREQAIAYMMENEPTSEESAIVETERYMAIPGQALSYKIGALKINELREKYSRELNTKFNIAEFHKQLLSSGSLPFLFWKRSWTNGQHYNPPCKVPLAPMKKTIL